MDDQKISQPNKDDRFKRRLFLRGRLEISTRLPCLASANERFFFRKDQCHDDYVEIYTIHTDSTKQMMGRYCSTSSPGPVVSPRGTVGIELFLHTDKEAVYSGFKGRWGSPSFLLSFLPHPFLPSLLPSFLKGTEVCDGFFGLIHPM